MAGRPGTNRLAVAAVVLAAVGVIPLGVAFGAVALGKTKKTGQGGRGLAITGLVLCGIWSLVVLIVATAGATVGARRPENKARRAIELTVGSCFNDHGGATEGPAPMVRVLPCTKPHNAEVFAVPTLVLDETASEDSMRASGSTECHAHLPSYVLDTVSLPAGTRLKFFYPLTLQWMGGSQHIVCLFAMAEPVSRSMREDATTLTADQYRYLKAVQVVNNLFRRIEAGSPAPSWIELRALSTQMVGAVTDERTALRAGPWPSGARAGIDQMIAEENLAIPLWQEAEWAQGEADVRRLTTAAERYSGQEGALGVRTALGLSTRSGEPPTEP
jgi:hypothetical protein